MSDVMPYESRRFSSLDDRELALYESAWKRHLRAVVEAFRPQVIHSHHLWLVGSYLKDCFPDLPVFSHCHGTGIRQLALCPKLAGRVIDGCRRNDHFFALHEQQRQSIAEHYEVEPERIEVIGAGYRDDVFYPRGHGQRHSDHIAYAGKLSNAKGLPSLLDAVAAIGKRRSITLHVAGAGSGPESDALRQRMATMTSTVTMHGQLGQNDLAELLSRVATFVLPSFYEGLPLVLIEAAAAGCRLVATALPGVTGQLAPPLGELIELVDLPRLNGPDRPFEQDLPAFADKLAASIERAMDAPMGAIATDRLRAFTWDAVFESTERAWREHSAAR